VLPATCPCPLDSYCDLASNTCKPGCSSNDNCPAKQRCDVPSRTCVKGCETANDCTIDPKATTVSCKDRQCVQTCAQGTSYACNGACVAVDDLNACGQACAKCDAAKITHAHAACVPNDVLSSTDSSCQILCDDYYEMNNGQCVPKQITCYTDSDGDGWGNMKGSTTTAVGGPCPKGYGTIVAPDGTQTNGDCDDTDANVFPGQTKTFTTSYGASKSFDYNCDGQATPAPVIGGAACSGLQMFYTCSSLAMYPDYCGCSAQLSTGTETCGATVQATPCTVPAKGQCNPSAGGAQTVTVACN
jgi:hypothetical protein